MNCFIFVLKNNEHNFNCGNNSDNRIDENTTIGGGYGIIANYTNSGDFLDWYIYSGAFSTFSNTGDYVRMQNTGIVQEGKARRNFPLVSTNILRYYDFSFSLSYSNPSHLSDFYVKFYYNDSTTTLIKDISWSLYPDYFPSDKFLVCIECWVKCADNITDNIRVTINDELYYGFKPELSNWSVNNLQYNLNEEIYFYCNFENCTIKRLVLEYLQTGLMTSVNMISDWTSLTYYYLYYALNREGVYRYYFLGGNGVIYNYTPSYYFEILELEYPKSSYLSLFSSLNGFPLESKDFKVYVGESEEQSLVDFISFYGNWSTIYINTSVNADFVDNYISFNCSNNNGLKTYFENNIGYSTLYYNVLLFQIKVEYESYLALMYNPLYIEKTYYIHFNSTNCKYWMNVQIPFFYFTTYHNYTNDHLFQLGFWTNNGSYSIANIRIAHYYDNVEEGQYLGIYSFRNDIVGSNPSNWIITEQGKTNISVIAQKTNHKQVVVFNDNDNSTYNCWMVNAFSNQNVGNVELWVMVNDSNTRGLTFSIYDNTIMNCIYVTFWNHYIQYYDSSWHNIISFSANMWIHLRFEFDIDLGFKLWVNNTCYPNSGYFSFRGIPTKFNYMQINTFGTNAIQGFIDAIDYSWSVGYYLNRNMDFFEYETYRLISEGNRQNPNTLWFDSSQETIAILDYFDNVLYRQEVNYQAFIDVALPIFDLTIINKNNYTIIVNIQRGLGVYIQIVIPENSFITLSIFSTNYLVEVRNLNMQLLNITSFSPNRTRTYTLSYGTSQNIEFESMWDIIIDFFLGSWYGIVLLVGIIAIIVITIIDFVLNIKKNRRNKRKAKRQEIEKTKEELQGSFV